MKRCSCCKKLLPESEFWKNKAHKDGLQNCCKSCCTAINNKLYKAKIIKQNMMNAVSPFYDTQQDYAVRGIRISILNQPKAVEFMFNINNLNTGENFQTNDKERFFVKLEKLLGRVAA